MIGGLLGGDSDVMRGPCEPCEGGGHMYKCDLCVAMGEMGGIFIYNYIYIYNFHI